MSFITDMPLFSSELMFAATFALGWASARYFKHREDQRDEVRQHAAAASSAVMRWYNQMLASQAVIDSASTEAEAELYRSSYVHGGEFLRELTRHYGFLDREKAAPALRQEIFYFLAEMADDDAADIALRHRPDGPIGGEESHFDLRGDELATRLQDLNQNIVNISLLAAEAMTERSAAKR